VFDAKSNTLYVASTGDNAIYAIRGAGTTRLDRGTGRIVYQDSTHLHGPLGMTMAPDGNLIAAQSDAVNSDPKQPSELVEFTTKGKFIGQFSISTEQGGAFGVATSSTRQQFAAVNDITNSVQIWTVRP
jgi:sugar lactone lactonase YvrE